MRTSPIRTALALAILVSAAACKSEKAADAASGTMSFDWSQRSADGKVEIRQRRESRGAASTCRVQAFAIPGDKVLWSGTTCIPAPSGLVFVAGGGEKLIVLDLFPAAGVQSPDWSQVSLAQLWSKGAVTRHYRGAEILAGDRARDMRTSFSWLRGETYEQVRESARAVAGGAQVSMDLADGRTVTLGFDGAPLPTPPSVAPVARPSEVTVAADQAVAALPARDEPPPPQAQPAQQPGALLDGELYRWEDESGAVHFGHGSEVPPKLAKRARPVQGRVGVVPMDAPEGPPPGQPAQPGQPGAGQPRAGQPAQPAATTAAQEQQIQE